MITKMLLIFCGVMQIISCDKEPEEILVVRIVFDSSIGYISIIETMQNDTSVHLDTVIYEYLPSKTNGYQFQLEFKKDDSNGDYLIYSHSCENSIIISEVKINDDYTFSYLFNGFKKTEKDRTVNVSFEMLCD